MSLPPTDPQLVEAARNGDPEAWDHLVTQWLPRVLGWCTRLGGPRVDPEDAAQDTFLVAMDRIHKLQDTHRFSAWLVGITRRVLARHRRRAWLQRWVPGDPADHQEPVRHTSRAAELSELSRRVQSALEKLSARQREVLVLVDLEEATTAEAAELLDVPEGTIKSRLRRGRRRLLAEFERTDRMAESTQIIRGQTR